MINQILNEEISKDFFNEYGVKNSFQLTTSNELMIFTLFYIQSKYLEK
jgi:hypothetical protein